MRTIFSGDDLAKLRKNPCVFSCTERTINYTSEFKKRALELHAQGVTAREIWKQVGFDITKWKKDYFSSTLKDWRRIVKKYGIEGLSRLGGVQYDMGKPNKKEPVSVDKDRLKRLELQVKYLEAENDFLAKLRAKRAERNSGRARNSKSSES
ncbi:MAG: hypothetical protein M1459_00145 [Patescibacteria group bacterium]|nr:hypothetical protein [Patescibacteria group bacterium]